MGFVGGGYGWGVGRLEMRLPWLRPPPLRAPWKSYREKGLEIR